MVGGEVSSGGVCRHHRIGVVLRSGGDTVICFFMPAQTKGTAYSGVGGGVLCWWRHNLLVAEADSKKEVGANFEEV